MPTCEKRSRDNAGGTWTCKDATYMWSWPGTAANNLSCPRRVDEPGQVPSSKGGEGLTKGEADPGRRPEAHRLSGEQGQTLQQAGPYAVEALAQNTTAEFLDKRRHKEQLAATGKKNVLFPTPPKNGLSG